jgi:hypothetical protein
MTEEIQGRNEERRKAFAKASAALFPPRRRNEIVRRTVENRERFERMAEACLPAVRAQDRWMLQTARVSWGVFAE